MSNTRLFDANTATAAANHSMVEIHFKVGDATVVLRLHPDTALALSRQLEPVALTARHR